VVETDNPETKERREAMSDEAVAGLRKKLRDALSTQKVEFKHEIVKVDEHDYEVRQPTVKQRGEILRKSEVVTNERKERDVAKLTVWQVIDLTYIPGTQERVFDKKDYNWLMGLPTGTWFDELANASGRMMQLADTASKNSDKTEPDKASSE
jgi:hypothetical protein